MNNPLHPYVNNTKTLNKPSLNVVSLCYGYGGLDAGLKAALPLAETILLSEWDFAACEILIRRMEMGEHPCIPIWTDLRTLPWGNLVGKVDGITGGFPCQPFSIAGARKADSDPRHLFPYIKAAISAVRPKFVFLENVTGILHAKLGGDGWADPAGTPVGLHVIRELQRLSYKATLGVFSAAEVGLPHERKRVFFAAVREDCVRNPHDHGLEFNEPSAAAVGPIALGRGAGDMGTVSDAVGAPQRQEVGSGQGSIRHGGEFRAYSGTDYRASVAGRGQPQHGWEFPRTCHDDDPQVIAPVGCSTDGAATVVGYANSRLCEPHYRKTGLRLCGNGVVPATAARAAYILFTELIRP
jgi:site-specific DNA-cytosine methylase